MSDAELREQILKLGTVRFAAGVFKQKQYDDGSVSKIEHSVQEIVEIGVDDLMQLIAAHNRTLIKAILAEDVPEKILRDTEFNPPLAGTITKVYANGPWAEAYNAAIDQITTALQKRLEQ